MRVGVLLCAVCVVVTSAAPSLPKHVLPLRNNLVQQSDSNERALSSKELGDVSAALKAELDTLVDVEEKVHAAQKVLNNGANVLNRGLCNFVGFCENNPARSCQEIVSQPGTNNAELPDGRYWIEADPATLPNGTATLPAERLECIFDVSGHGWLLLFDDTYAQEVKQQPGSEILKYYRFKEMLVYTPKILRQGLSPVKQSVYYVDDSRIESTQGKTLEDLHNYPWAGQDGWGAANDKGANFPNAQVHFRWKYFGKIQNSGPYINTLYILDDGDVQDATCKLTLDLEKCGQDFGCSSVNGTTTASGMVAQTNLPTTSRGVISFGCTSTADRFTHCGSCNYDGPYGDTKMQEMVQDSVVQKMYVR